jgi:hypothetical protein
MLRQHGDRLNSQCRERVENSIRRALGAIAHIDVSLEYTNIVLKDITNTLLGGELLQEPVFTERGRAKLDRWVKFTMASGGVFELNSPVYAPLCLKALSYLADNIRDGELAVLARSLATRIGLSYALHIHPSTGCLAGPYSRSYAVLLYAGRGFEENYLARLVETGRVPGWIGDIPTTVELPHELVEGFHAPSRRMYTTYMSNSYSLGSATTELDSQSIRYIAGQSNVFLMNFKSPDSEMGGFVFSRYLIDEKWYGDYKPTPCRSYKKYLCEEGRFLGVQKGSACIGAYAPRNLGAMEFSTAAKMVIVIAKRALVKGTYIDGEPVTSFPVNFVEGAVICFDFGEALLAIRPFRRTLYCSDAPLRILQRGDDLVLEVYNYLGASKTFWELAQPGSFYQGQPQCAFYAEAAERSEYGNATAFSHQVMSGRLTDEVDALPNSQTRRHKRMWKLGYARGEQSLGMEVDLMDWNLSSRSANGEELPFYPMRSKVVRQGGEYPLKVEGATLEPGSAQLWIYGNASEAVWVVGGMAEESSNWLLHLPGRTLKVVGFRYGTLTVRGDAVTLEANTGAEMHRT